MTSGRRSASPTPRPATTGDGRPSATAPSTATATSPQRDRAPRRRWLPPLVLAVIVGAFAVVPLLRTPSFYFWDDSAAVFLPTWRAIGLDLLSGTWPTIRPDFWMGGNWAAEAQFGLWNPVNLLVALVVATMSDLAVAAALVKAAFLVLLALGTYVLAREYGSSPWPAVAVAAALPFSGFTLYYDAATWVAGLMAFAWTPWFWWAARRCMRGALNPIVVFVIGYLLITNGNPYGALAAVLVLAGVAVEALVTGNRAGFLRLVVVGACVGATAGVAYLPLVLSSDAGWRESEGLANDGFLVPDLTMLAATSTPSMLPFIRVWSGSGSTVPITFSAWFLVPLLPWLAWDVLRGRARELSSIGVILLAYLALALGPSQLWLFRWPARLLEYVFLAVFLTLAVMLSAGFRTTSWRTRATVTALLVGFGAWLAISARPEPLRPHAVGTALAVVLVAALVVAAVRVPRGAPLVMIAGIGVVLLMQTALAPANRDVAVWDFPTAVADLDAYADRYVDPLVQIAASERVPPEDRPAAWADLLFGSMPGAAGVESTASYTGLGYDEFSATLCANHTGATCAEALTATFAPAGQLVPVPHLVDALKANTVVIQNDLLAETDVVSGLLPADWRVIEETERVTVLRRDGALPWPDTRLAAASDGTTAEVLSSGDKADHLRVSTGPEGGALLFSRLAWPGYVATVDGESVEVHENPEGLVEVALPPGLEGSDVRLGFQVPGLRLAIPLLLLGTAGALVQGVAWARRRTARAG